MSPILELKDLKTNFKTDEGTITVVDGVDFTIKNGKTLGVVGESGCGKSVTSLSIMGLLARNATSEGSIKFEGKEILNLHEKQMRKIRGNDIAMIFQEPMTSLNPLHTIGKQIIEPIRIHFKVSKAEAKKRAIVLMENLGLPRAEEIFDSHPHQLSGGMRQRIMIAIAIACNPKLIIADEPTTALDVTIQAQILDLMKELKEESGMSIMLITHDLAVIAEMCDSVVVMYAGQVVEETDVVKLFEEPKHPYTQGLINSIPSIDEEKEYLNSIPGSVPLPGQMPIGCRFAPRCRFAMDICHQAAPELIEIDQNHKSRCWLHAEEKEVSN